MPDGLVALNQKHVAGPVRASLNYLTPIPAKPQTYNYGPPAGVPRQNFDNEAHQVLIEDIRGRETDFSLDRHGFAATKHSSRETDFAREESILALYYPESEALLQDRLNAQLVLIFDHTIRRRDPAGADREGARQPVARVHVDQTVRSGRERVFRHLPDEAETSSKVACGSSSVATHPRPGHRPSARHGRWLKHQAAESGGDRSLLSRPHRGNLFRHL